MTFGTRLKTALVEANVKQKDVADRLDVSPQAVSGWVRDIDKPEPDKLPVIARMIGKSVDWLLQGEAFKGSEDIADGLDSPLPKRSLPVKGYVGAGGQAQFVSAGDLDEIEARPGDGQNAVAVQIVGTSLGALYNGWFAVYDDVRQPVTEDLVGRVCVVGLSDGRILVKKIKRSGRFFDLISGNDAEQPIRNVEIEWAAKVLDIRSP